MIYEERVKRNRDIMKMRSEGASAGEIASAVGLKVPTVRLIIRTNGKTQKTGPSLDWSRSRRTMVAMREKGYTYADIGHLFGLSRQRAHQIVKGAI
jgi:DNA-directed RNA polymerase specialized sigma24 family protein